MAKKQFDLRTHIRDKQGRLKQSQPYRLRIVNGEKRYERPVGSGNFYYESGEPIPKAPSKPEKEAAKPAPNLKVKEELKPKKPQLADPKLESEEKPASDKE